VSLCNVNFSSLDRCAKVLLVSLRVTWPSVCALQRSSLQYCFHQVANLERTVGTRLFLVRITVTDTLVAKLMLKQLR